MLSTITVNNIFGVKGIILSKLANQISYEYKFLVE